MANGDGEMSVIGSVRRKSKNVVVGGGGDGGERTSRSMRPMKILSMGAFLAADSDAVPS